MHRSVLAALALTLAGCAPMGGGPYGDYEVAGVEDGDMLKLRAGPGTGFDVIAGLPNGTVLRLAGCERTGGTRWCRATAQEARGLSGYVSWAYLREL